MTINEAIYAVLDGSNISTDDFPVRKRFIYGELKNARNEMIKQELNKGTVDLGGFQTIEKYTVKLLHRLESPMVDNLGTLHKGEEKLPMPIEYKNGLCISVSFANGTLIDPVDIASWNSRKVKRHKLPDFVGWFFQNGIVFVVGADDIDELDLMIEGQFSDPEIIDMMNSDEDCEENACKPIYELEFRCPSLILRRVIEVAKASVLRKLSIPIDDSNNAKFDTANGKDKIQPDT